MSERDRLAEEHKEAFKAGWDACEKHYYNKINNSFSKKEHLNLKSKLTQKLNAEKKKARSQK